MRNNTTTSSFKKVLSAFLVFAVMAAGTEAYFYAHRPNVIRDYWNKFLINEHVLVDQPQDFDYLIIGDSIQKTGIDPRRLDGKFLNMGLPGGKPLGLYLLFKRYLEHHKPPKAVFVYIDPEDSHDSLLIILRLFVSVPEALSVWMDLTPKERSVFIMRYWASLDLRKIGLTVRDQYPHPNDVFVRSLISNRGYMDAPGSDEALPERHFPTNTKRIQKSVSFTKTDFKYLDKFMELARSKKIRVVFLGFVIPEELYYIFEKTGFNNSYAALYGSFMVRYPDASFVGDPIIFFENRYFGDDSHMNKKGVELYTEYFKDKVFSPFMGRTSPDGK